MTKGRCCCGQVTVCFYSCPAVPERNPTSDASFQVATERSVLSYDSLMCHCNACKRRSGGLASFAFMVPKNECQIIEKIAGAHIMYMDSENTTSGKPMQRTMCKNCGSPVFVIEAHAPDTRCLQYGLFAGEVDELPKPKLELFRKEACSWEAVLGQDVKNTQ